MLNMEDIFRWPCTPDGRIMVRSAYHAIKNANTSAETNEAMLITNTSSNIWSAIWRAKVWPKVQVFMWRLVTNLVAVKSNLV